MTLVDAALELMAMAGIGAEAALGALGPILRTTTENLLEWGPERALTGPIRRGDAGTIRRHLAAVEHARPETRRLYVAAGLRVRSRWRNGRGSTRVRRGKWRRC